MRLPFDKTFRITSPFGWRIHPVDKTKKHHNGADFGAPAGTWIEAIEDGVVIYAGPSKTKLSNGEPGGFGYYVQVRHVIGKITVVSTYAHMAKGSIVVKKGQKVAEGTPLGKVGSTGTSTAPHLHLEISKGKDYRWSSDGSTFYDPIKFIKAQMALEAEHKAADKATPEDAPLVPAPPAPKPATPKPPVATKPTPKAATYKVKAGDSYWSIAEKNGLDFKALQKLNGDKPLHPGDSIRLK